MAKNMVKNIDEVIYKTVAFDKKQLAALKRIPYES